MEIGKTDIPGLRVVVTQVQVGRIGRHGAAHKVRPQGLEAPRVLPVHPAIPVSGAASVAPTRRPPTVSRHLG